MSAKGGASKRNDILTVWKSYGNGMCDYMIPKEHTSFYNTKLALFDFDDTIVRVFRNDLLPNVV